MNIGLHFFVRLLGDFVWCALQWCLRIGNAGPRLQKNWKKNFSWKTFSMFKWRSSIQITEVIQSCLNIFFSFLHLVLVWNWFLFSAWGNFWVRSDPLNLQSIELSWKCHLFKWHCSSFHRFNKNWWKLPIYAKNLHCKWSQNFFLYASQIFICFSFLVHADNTVGRRSLMFDLHFHHILHVCLNFVWIVKHFLKKWFQLYSCTSTSTNVCAYNFNIGRSFLLYTCTSILYKYKFTVHVFVSSSIVIYF